NSSAGAASGRGSIIPAEATRARGEQRFEPRSCEGTTRLARSRIASPSGLGFQDDGCASIPLDAHGDAHAAADAQRREPLLAIAPRTLEQEGVEGACPGAPDRMAEGDGAAVDVDLLGVPAEPLIDRAGLSREGLVGLDQIEILHAPAGLLQRLLRGRDRASP